MSLVRDAQIFAGAAHRAVKQLRKYTHEPYIVHPAEVASIVAQVPGATEEMIAAAWLHDVVEDTGITNDEIHLYFGADVAKLVFWLTDASKPEDGNRAVRKAIDREHMFRAPAEAQTIKLADLISNTKSIVEYDPEFAKIYLKEKKMLLDVMTKGNAALMAEARKHIGE